MLKRTCLAALAVASVSLTDPAVVAGRVAAAASDALQSPPAIRPVPPIHYADPKSFGQMIRTAGLVALVRVRSHEYTRIGSQLLTHYDAEVVELFRGPDGLVRGRAIDIYQPGGVASLADGTTVDYRDRNFRRLTDGGYAVLVLEWNPTYAGYFPSYGENGTFEFLLDSGAQVLTGSVRTQGRVPEVAALNGMPIASFVSLVRAAAGGGL